MKFYLISSDLSLICYKVEVQVHSFLGTVSNMSDRSYIPSSFLQHPEMLWHVLLVFWEQRKPSKTVKKLE